MKPHIISNQFPIYVPKKPAKYGLYEVNRLVMERPRELYRELIAEQKKMVKQGIKLSNLKIKGI